MAGLSLFEGCSGVPARVRVVLDSLLSAGFNSCKARGRAGLDRTPFPRQKYRGRPFENFKLILR